MSAADVTSARFGAAVSHSDSGVAVKEQFGDGESDDVASADHYRLLTFNLHACLVEHLDDTFWGAGQRAGEFLPE